MEEIYVSPPFIKLEQFLKFAAIAETGGHAKLLIQDSQVLVNGQVCLMRGKKLYNDDVVEVLGIDEKFKCVITNDD